MNETMTAQIIFSEQRTFRSTEFSVNATFNAVLVGDCKHVGSYLIFDECISADDWAQLYVDLSERLAVQSSSTNEAQNLRIAIAEADEWFEVCRHRFQIAQQTYAAEKDAQEKGKREIGSDSSGTRARVQ